MVRELHKVKEEIIDGEWGLSWGAHCPASLTQCSLPRPHLPGAASVASSCRRGWAQKHPSSCPFLFTSVVCLILFLPLLPLEGAELPHSLHDPA